MSYIFVVCNFNLYVYIFIICNILCESYYIIFCIFFFSLWAPFHIVLFNTFLLLLTVSHLRAMCSDPGTVPLPHSNGSLSDLRQGIFD